MYFIVHGWATDSRIMEPFAGSLADRRGCEVISADLPDYRTRSESNNQVDYPSKLAETIDRAMPAGKTFSLVGWSMGAMIALEYALNHPDNKLNSLVLIAGCGKFVGGPDNPDGVEPGKLRLMKRGLKRNPAETLDNFYDDIFSDSETEIKESFLREFRNQYHGFPAQALIPGLDYLEKTNLLDRLTNLELPVLLIHGGEDKIIRHTLSDILLESLPQAKMLKLDGAGHAPFMDRQEEIIEAISEFRYSK